SPVNRLLRLAEVAPYPMDTNKKTRSVNTAGFLFGTLTREGDIEKLLYTEKPHNKCGHIVEYNIKKH
ncbi:TPA: hypothetical protein ACWXEZ_003071, partial [Escherichia coli]